MIILLDNGHGCETAGKRSPDGMFREYAWAREIASRLEKEFLAANYDVRCIVPEDTDISLKERTKRVNEICNKYGKENVILISIHVNAASNGKWSKARGWSAYTSKGNTQSDEIANELYSAAANILPMEMKIRKDFSDGDCDWEENFYLLKNTFCPAVLTENFFMDNKDDLKFLQSEYGKVKIVKLHFKGIVNYLHKKLSS